MAHFLGIEIGGTKIQLISADEEGRIQKRYRFAVDPRFGAQSIRENIEGVLAGPEVRNVIFTGVGFGGPINRKDGVIFRSYHVDGWDNFSIKSWLEEKTGKPAVVDNDANVAALGEAKWGAGRAFDSVLYITMGSGVGAGFVKHNRIFHSSPPGELEFGHIRLDRSGRTVQDACSGWALDRTLAQIAEDYPNTPIARLSRGVSSGNARFLLAAIAEGDQRCVHALDQLVDNFCFALSHAVHLLHPDVVVIGGGLSLLGEALRGRIEKRITVYLMDAFQPGPRIVLSGLKEDVVPLGAIAMAIETSKKVI